MKINSIKDIVAAAIKAGPKRLAVVAAEEAEALQAAVDAYSINLAKPVLIGAELKIKNLAKDLKLDLTNIEIINEPDEKQCAKIAINLVKEGKIDFFMKGLIATSDLLKAVLNKETGLNTGKLASHVAVMSNNNYHKPFLVTDAAINIKPDLNAKKDILNNALSVARAIGITYPKVAILSAVEKVNPKIPSTLDAAELKSLNETGKITDCVIDGPFAVDNTFSKKAAAIKGITSSVAGDADIVLADDLESGNILYKSVIFLGNGQAAGIVMGAAKPIVVTSRADDKETKMASIALGVLITNK